MKKTALIALAAMTVLGLSACSDDGDVSVKGTGSSSTSSTSSSSDGSSGGDSAASSSAPAGSSAAASVSTGTATAGADSQVVTAKSKEYSLAAPKDAQDFMAEAVKGQSGQLYEVALRGTAAKPFSIVSMGQPKGAQTLEQFAQAEACTGVATGMSGTSTPAPDITIGGEPAKGCTIVTKDSAPKTAKSYAVFHGSRQYLLLVTELTSSVTGGSKMADDVLGSVVWAK